MYRRVSARDYHVPDMNRTYRMAWRLFAYALPLLVIVALGVIYAVSPAFYLKYVLEIRHREYQAVENLNFACALTATLLLAWCGWRLWADPPHEGAGLLQRRGDALLVTLIALGALFITGEEVNWGQTFLHWGTPELDRENVFETNFHNNVSLINAQGLGTLGLGGIFFILPAVWAWRLRHDVGWRGLWRAIPDGPSIFCLAVALAWRSVKRLYILVFGKSKDNVFYRDFIEQINEQKELLIALALLIYAVERVVRLRRGGRPGG